MRFSPLYDLRLRTAAAMVSFAYRRGKDPDRLEKMARKALLEVFGCYASLTDSQIEAAVQKVMRHVRLCQYDAGKCIILPLHGISSDLVNEAAEERLSLEAVASLHGFTVTGDGMYKRHLKATEWSIMLTQRSSGEVAMQLQDDVGGIRYHQETGDMLMLSAHLRFVCHMDRLAAGGEDVTTVEDDA